MRSVRGLTGVAVVVVALVAGCREPGVRNGLGALEAAPEEVDFGAVALGRDREMEISLTNGGRVPYSVYEVKTSVPNVGVDFEPITLQAGEKRNLKVRFSPQVEGVVQGQVTILTDEHETPYAVDFSGRGVKAIAELDKTALEFGQVETETAKVLSVNVRNPTDVETAVRFSIEGDVQHFSSSEADKDLVLQPGEARDIPFAFNPSFIGIWTARATFTLCEACEPAVVTLNGEGIVDKLEIYPTRIDFGRVSLGSTATETVIIRNLGTETVRFGGTEFIKAPEGLFTVTANGGDIPSGQTRLLHVTFTPNTTGLLPNAPPPQLKIDLTAANVPSAVKLPIYGEGGMSCIAVLPKALDFGMVPEGMSATRRVDLMNRCTYDVTLLEAAVTSTVGGFFSLAQPSSATVMPAGTITPVRVTFTPKMGVTSSEGAMTIKVQEKNATSTEQVNLKGASKAFAPCSYSLLPAMLDFGAMPVGAEAVLGVALKNTGNDDCFVGGMQLAAGSDPEFKAEPLNSAVIKPGESAVLRVSFKPSAVGTFSALMEGWVNHPTNNHPTALITGKGVQGCFALQPTKVDYGTTKLSCGPRTRTVVAYNTCTAPVNITQVLLDAPATTEFAITQQPAVPLALAPGKQTTFEVTYAPTNDGIDTAALRVTADGTMYTAGLDGLGLSQPTKTDRFVQDSQAKVDVLFVIDNSGSMMEEQQSLGANFNAFLSAAQAQFVDYQIGVTTTGIDPSPGGWSVCPGGVDGGEAGRLFPVVGGGPRIITPSTANAAAVFASNVNVGWCHWNEQGLEAAYRALSTPLVNSTDDVRTSQPNDGNGGFLRQDAKLAIVFLTDEEDYSTQDLAFYETFFKSVKNNDPTMLSISAIVGPQNLATCPTASSSGTRYISLANATGGAVESICASDWSKALENISKTTFGPKRAFPLSDMPMDINQITVTVNGAPASGWVYDSQSNSVIFDENNAPSAGSVVEVTYPLGC